MKRFHSVLDAPNEDIRFCSGEFIEDDSGAIHPKICAIDLSPRRFLIYRNCADILLLEEHTAKDEFESTAGRGRT